MISSSNGAADGPQIKLKLTIKRGQPRLEKTQLAALTSLLSTTKAVAR